MFGVPERDELLLGPLGTNANGVKDDAPFDDLPRFRPKLVPYDAGWVEPMLRQIADCPALKHPPAPECVVCDYVAKASAIA